MITEEKAFSIKPFLEDKSFCEKIAQAESDTAVCKLFAEQGIELSESDVQELGRAIENCKEVANEELSEQDLENVAGGYIVALAVTFGICVIAVTALSLIALNHPEWLGMNSIAIGAKKKKTGKKKNK